MKKQTPEFNVRLGRAIRARRMKRGWSQKTLARRAGISAAYLSDIEHGQRGVGFFTIIQICRVLRRTVSFLAREAMKAEPKKKDQE